MSFTAQVDQVQWFVGKDVEAQKAKVKQVDESFCIRILDRIFGLNGPLHAQGQLLQRICNEARIIVSGNPVQNPITFNNHSIWEGYQPNGHDGPSTQIRGLAQLHLYRGDAIINPLAFGDVLRALADRFGESPDNGDFAPLKALLRSLQNPQAFNKSTNRVRIKRRDILNPIPPVGITQWYLPNDDMLGTIDRLLGYYETGDISGSATDAIGAMAIVKSINDQGQIGAVDAIKDRIVGLINNGQSFACFAAMVAQLHHSLPEVMMAINLVPRRLRPGGPLIQQIYSPFLTNRDFDAVGEIYGQWQQARWTALGGGGDRPANQMRAIFVLQDIFQMPNVPSEDNEICIVVPFTYDVSDNAPDSNNPNIFGVNFYNTLVTLMNRGNPGPAVTMQRVSNTMFGLIFPGGINPQVPVIALGETIQRRTEIAMQLRRDLLANANTYNLLVAPFLDAAVYGQIERADVLAG